ncbi:hypothetical protein [Mucilaginibacter psychrotolerans]|uniref:Uncharacterized protein n=1 Tax=Mucilaginibacter psychrotolerans TaxID=1524096 RepID=A0A4Y8SCT7_9SPHI|nr:hypothetical protein [Mucilaginibacter psychrotolerans]TFF36758.1 hypothetical protein E2R66_15045 [Mucilaginibacter psychrotolerans]
MTNSILEITENEYLIKLNRSTFDLSFIRSLLKMVEVSKPSEQKEFNYIDSYLNGKKSDSSEPEYYSSIDEK